MSGFFSKKEIQSDIRPDGKVYSCYSCGLNGRCNSPEIKPTGNFKKGIMNVISHVSGIDDLKGKHWQGKQGKVLKEVYKKFGVDLHEDCINVHAVRCLPIDKTTKKERSATSYEIACCRIRLLEDIKKYKPKVIILFGQAAIESVIGFRWKDGGYSINKWRGEIIPDQHFQAYLCPVFSLSYVLKDNFKHANTIWQQDIENGLNVRKKPFPVNIKPNIQVIKNLKKLNSIKNNTKIAFDYETTGLKPHAKGHKIICCSVATSENDVFVFMMPNEKKKRKPFLDLLMNKHIKKMAHNMKFEHTWSLVRLGTVVKGWFWDSMLVAHILSNKRSITGLKFQTYINFGIEDYSEEIEKYLRGDDKNANSFNNLRQFVSIKKGQETTLYYCALDSIYQYRLSVKQQEEVELIELPF